MEVPWAHNWEVILACFLLLVLLLTFLLFVWKMILCWKEEKKRRKIKNNYLNLEDHMPTVKIVIPSKDPRYRVLEEYHSKENLASSATDSNEMSLRKNFGNSDTDIERPNFQTKSFHMQQLKT